MTAAVNCCRLCGTSLQSATAMLCVLCFGRLHKPCPRCCPQGMLSTVYDGPDALRCVRCNDQRFVVDFQP